MSKARELLKQLHEQLHISENDAGFDTWMSKVKAEVQKLSGVSADDLPDVAYHDWYDDGVTPSRAARRAVKNAEMGEDVGKPEGGNPAAALGEELSRKYYEAIAQILKDNKDWDAILAALISLFKADNPRFNADRFAQAAMDGGELELGEVDGKPSPSNFAPKTNPQINKDRAAADRDFEHEKKFGKAR